MRDTVYRTEDPSEDIDPEQLQSWRALAHKFFESVEAQHSAKKGASKIQRLSAFDWVRGVDWMLVACTGEGLARFAPIGDGCGDDPIPVHKRPVLSLALDKGSDGFAGTWAMLNNWKLRIAPFFDPFHIPWRDLDRFMDEACIKTSMVLKTVSHNMEFGPWDGEAWAQQLRDTAKKVSKLSGPDDPVLLFWWPRIQHELGLSDEEATPAAIRDWLVSLPSLWWLQKKGPRVCTSRWGTFAEAEDRPHPPIHTHRLMD